MKIFPAIDLKDNSVVRLTQGDYKQVKIYSTDPASIAKKFLNDGAEHLHIVDLDGAKEGYAINLEAIKAIKSVDGLFTEIGGGIRTEEQIEKYLNLGINRVILGTVAVNDFDFTAQMGKKYGSKIVVGVDAKDGFVAVNGWLEKTEIDSFSLCKRLLDVGIDTVIYTDISRDGMLKGCNLPVYEKLCRIDGLKVVASGGVSSLEEIKNLKNIGCDGAIVGKAIFEGKISLKDAVLEAKR